MRPSLLFFLFLLAASLAPRAHAQSCAQPAVLFVLDRSASMNEGVPGAESKWAAALGALRQAADVLEGRGNVGLRVFPADLGCDPGATLLALGPHSADALVAAAEPPPTVGAYTPLAEALDALADEPWLSAGEGPQHVVLITDGWQWCAPYDAATRFTPIGAAARLRSLGVIVHVVGFGAGVDALTLNRVAVAGGAPRPGCDPDGADVHGADPCYHDAHAADELGAVLTALATTIGDERCNGVDDDCDGGVDEGFDRDGDGVTVCAPAPDCDDEDPSVFPGAHERCDGIDADCDGAADVGCECPAGAVRSCGEGAGYCGLARQRCVEGRWGVCEGGRVRADERCNGVDDDCDDRVDEYALCPIGGLCLAGRCRPLLPDAGAPNDAGVGGEAEVELPPPTLGCACVAAAAPAPADPSAVVWGLAGVLGGVVRRWGRIGRSERRGVGRRPPGTRSEDS